MRRLLTFAAMLIALGLVGFFVLRAGQPSSDPDPQAARASASASRHAEQEQARYERALKKYEEYAQCKTGTRRYLDALRTFHSRLSVGLVFQDYNRGVGNLRVAYDRLPLNRLSLKCQLRVTEPGRRAFNRYNEANGIWNDCVSDLYCEFDSIDPEMQKKWAAATVQVSKAQQGLRKLRVPRPASPSPTG